MSVEGEHLIGSYSRAFGAATKAQSPFPTSLDRGTVKSSCFEDLRGIELEEGQRKSEM